MGGNLIYSRSNPSPRYIDLVEQYKEMHSSKYFKYFTGIGCYKAHKEIRRLVRETGVKTLLDFGCGGGRQLVAADPEALFSKLEVFCSSWTEALGVDRITGYDPGVEAYNTPPNGTFGGVYCCDCLEHCPESDLTWIIDEIFSYAEKFVFLTVALAPAKKNLPNGENAHATLKTQDWWLTLIDSVAKQHSHVRYEVVFEEEVIKEKHHD